MTILPNTKAFWFGNLTQLLEFNEPTKIYQLNQRKLISSDSFLFFRPNKHKFCVPFRE